MQKKKVIKSKNSKKKTKASLRNIWGRDLNLIKETGGQCKIKFGGQYIEGCFDRDFGLIALMRMNKIPYTSIEEDYKLGEITYSFDKEYTNKIKSIAKDYFAHKIQVDAKKLTDLINVHMQWNEWCPPAWRRAAGIWVEPTKDRQSADGRVERFLKSRKLK